MATIPKDIWNQALREMTLVVEIQLPKMPRLLILRLWLGIKLIKLAAIIMGCSIEVIEQ